MAKIVIVGHVDHGKSTLLGRVLLDCGSVSRDRIEKVRQICEEKGVALEPAFLLDALKEEQEQGISIDTTRVHLEYRGRRFVLIDAPGHIEFLKNMATAASEADLAVVVIDCLEGIRAQTISHLKILAVLGLSKIIVVVNKLDRIGYSKVKFAEISDKIRETISKENLNCLEVIPVSALCGDNISKDSGNLSWYYGPAFLPCLESQVFPEVRLSDEPFRMLLQDVYKFDDKRLFAGKVVSGMVQPGAAICFSPSGKISTIATIEQFPDKQLDQAIAGDSIALTLSDQVFVERDEIISLPGHMPAVDNEISARIVWVGGQGFDPAVRYLVKIGTSESPCLIDMHLGEDRSTITNGDFATATIRAARTLAFDNDNARSAVNKLVICSSHGTVAFGAVDYKPIALQQVVSAKKLVAESGYVDRKEHERVNQHAGIVLWLTGLSGSGKSSLAKALQRQLFDGGKQVVVLDGDNLRQGLCVDLGFNQKDRSENIRRVAQTAKLFLDTGFVVIVATISPYAHDRDLAKQIIGEKDFREIFVFCPLEVCQSRDPKGLYARAKDGTLHSFSGHDMPYQPPQNPALRLDSSLQTIEDEAQKVLELVEGAINVF